ncbi:hypothetical protein [Mesoplasma tabanidae]|uniref:Uncharacterized protein n=1 Tax=Mesoplasma tabanidae TaxID=219745 RepID=A0A2K8P7G4_9MOLU|nr:hypothetical protein [Mesoplasma tabanidae]ATZ21683.1 hypothetical protein MTABA_v1c04850 [Mesoplasma tabanidae]
MKILISFLTALTVGQGTFGILEVTGTSKSIAGLNQNNDNIEYEAMSRAALTFGTKIRQSYFDSDSGYTNWSGSSGSKQILSRTKMKSDLTGPTQEIAYVYNSGNKGKTSQLDILNKNIFYGNDKLTYYFSESKIYKFDWKNNSYANYGLIGGIGGILGGVGGILGGVGGILGGVVGLLVPSMPKQEPVTGSESSTIEVYGRTIKDAVYNLSDDSITYTTLDDNGKDWTITKYHNNSGLSDILASGSDGLGNYPKLAVEKKSNDTYFVVGGKVSVYRDKNKKVENITALSDSRQAYNVFVDSEGMYIGLSDSNDTTFKAHDLGVIKQMNPKVFYVDRINDMVSEDNEGDGYIRGIQWVNDITKYVMYDSKTIVKSNSYLGSKYAIDGTKLNSNLTVQYHDGNPRYSGIFDYGVMYQADETYKTLTAKGKPSTGRGQVNRVFNDKFQETLRSSNLIGSSSLDWDLGPNGEIFIWYKKENAKPKLRLSAKSYISKVLLVEQDSEITVKNGVVYNKTDKDNQFWEVEIPDANADKGYDLYVQFFDEEKQPNNVITSIIRLRPSDIAKVDLSAEENSIKEQINISNNIKQSEIIAALTKVTGIKITESDVNINTDSKATYNKTGEINIKAIDSSKLVINKQIIEIPQLVYDISKTIFDPFETNIRLGIKDYEAKVIKKIADSSIQDNSTLSIDQVQQEIEIEISQPEITKNGSISVKAKKNSAHLKGEQTIILPALNAVSLAKLDFNEQKVSNSTTDGEILEIINKLINKEAIKVESQDIIIDRVKPAKVGQEGHIIIKADPESLKVSDSNIININKLKYDLLNFKIPDSSNLFSKEEIIRRLNLITGLGEVTDKDFDFELSESSVENEGSIKINAKADSELLEKGIEIIIPKTYNLAQDGLFKYNVNNESKEFIFYESTNKQDIVTYLQEEKGWSQLTEDDIDFVKISNASNLDALIYKIVAKEPKKVGSTFTIGSEQCVIVGVKNDRRDLSEIITSQIDIKRIDPLKIEGESDEELIKALKQKIMDESKKQINSAEPIIYEDLHINLIDRYKFEIIANEDSEYYVGSIEGKYYLQYDISIHKNDFKSGILINEEDRNDIDKLKHALYSQFPNTFIYWEETKISLDGASGNLLIEGKQEKSLYSGNLEIKVVLIQDLGQIIKVSNDKVSKNKFDENGLVSVIKDQNELIQWDQVDISVIIIGENAQVKIEPKEGSKMYVGIAKINFSIDNSVKSNSKHRETKIVLWILAVINIILIAIAAVFVKNKKKDEE